MRGELLRQRGVTRFRGREGDFEGQLAHRRGRGAGRSTTMRLRRAGPGGAGAPGRGPVRGLMRAIGVRMVVRCLAYEKP